MHKKILISGVTGFLGYSIAQKLLEEKHFVIGLKRTTSDLWRCEDFLDKIEWIATDNDYWKEQVISLQPDIVIHAAWSGVTATERDALSSQLKNLELTAAMLDIAKQSNAKCFVGLGSQAEYGVLNSVVSEDYVTNPVNAYGMTKILAATLLQKICELYSINWYWLRVFSVFGEKESTNWFIPFIIKSLILNENEIKLSACNQTYAYLYVKDFTEYVSEIIRVKPQSGVYNISGSNAKSLQRIIEDIKILIGNTETKLNYGALPPRANQSSIIEGSMKKFHENIGDIKETDWQDALSSTIAYYQNEKNN